MEGHVSCVDPERGAASPHPGPPRPGPGSPPRGSRRLRRARPCSRPSPSRASPIPAARSARAIRALPRRGPSTHRLRGHRAAPARRASVSGVDDTSAFCARQRACRPRVHSPGECRVRAHWSPASAARMAPSSPNYCSITVTRFRRRAACAEALRGEAGGDEDGSRWSGGLPIRVARRGASGAPAHEVYNLAAPSFVPRSWEEPVRTAEFAAVGATAMLEAIRRGRPRDPLLPGVVERDLRRAARDAADGDDALPVTPYGVAKAYAHFIAAATGGATACTPAAGSSTTTSRRGVPSTSCRARWRTPRPRSRSGSSTSSFSATSTRAATGATPGTTSARCG